MTLFGGAQWVSGDRPHTHRFTPRQEPNSFPASLPHSLNGRESVWGEGSRRGKGSLQGEFETGEGLGFSLVEAGPQAGVGRQLSSAT